MGYSVWTFQTEFLVWDSFACNYFSHYNSDCRSFDGIFAADYFGGDGCEFIDSMDFE